MISSVLLLDAYKVGKIIITSIWGVRVAVLSHKIIKGIESEEYERTTKEFTLYVAAYYCLPMFKNIIKSL